MIEIRSISLEEWDWKTIETALGMVETSSKEFGSALLVARENLGAALHPPQFVHLLALDEDDDGYYPECGNYHKAPFKGSTEVNDVTCKKCIERVSKRMGVGGKK